LIALLLTNCKEKTMSQHHTKPKHLHFASTHPDPASAGGNLTVADEQLGPLSPQPSLFLPRRVVRSGHIQTLLASRAPLHTRHLAAEYPILLDGGPSVTPLDGGRSVRLLAYYSPCRHPAGSRGLVVTLHGWEGCSHSGYDLMTTNRLLDAGFDVVRLNFRDHGPNYHFNRYSLNAGIFLGILIDEVATALHQVADMAHGLPFYIIGVSMGGNFALRLACRHRVQPFANLTKVIAVNPAVSPTNATSAIDRQRPYRHYFRKRWLASLLAKEHFFPELYDFGPLRTIPTIRGMTEWLVRHYAHAFGDFRTVEEYFAAYAVKADELAQLTVPVTIISAMDDPVVDANDLLALTPHPLLTRHLHPTGGHVGFVNIFPLQHHLPGMVMDALLA
jgi:predicted alpha/beta-fold hydrolase